MKSLLDLRTHLLTVIRLAIVPAVVLAAVLLPASEAHAASGFSFTPGNGSYQIGSNLTVTVRVDTGDKPTNAVAADFTYPANLLEYVSTDATGSAFNISAAFKAGNGSVSFNRGATTPVKGNVIVQKATFRVIGTGTATLSFKDSSVAVSSEDNSSNVAPDKLNATFGLAAAPTPPATPPPPPPAGNTAPKPASGPTTPPRKVTQITPVTSSATPVEPVQLINNETIEIATPIDVQPATIQSDGISKIEYSLNGELVKTVTVPPFKYRVDTTQLLNGKYRLTTKTYYTNGQTETVNQTLLVKNPFGLTQLRLSILKYFWVIFLSLLMLIGVVVALIARGRSKNSGSGGGSGGYDNIDPAYVAPPPSSVITPNISTAPTPPPVTQTPPPAPAPQGPIFPQNPPLVQ